jgi:hypothetical protein
MPLIRILKQRITALVQPCYCYYFYIANNYYLFTKTVPCEKILLRYFITDFTIV